MSARSTDGFPSSVPFALLLATSAETNMGEDGDAMTCSFPDKLTGTTAEISLPTCSVEDKPKCVIS